MFLAFSTLYFLYQGRTGRLQRSVDPTEDNFFASIVGTDGSDMQPKVVNSRKQRESRASRENVIQGRSIGRW